MRENDATTTPPGQAADQLVNVTAADRARMLELLRSLDADADPRGYDAAAVDAISEMNGLIAAVFGVWRDDDEKWCLYPYSGDAKYTPHIDPATVGEEHIPTSTPVDEIVVTGLVHKHGTMLAAHLTDEGEQQWLHKYVAENWWCDIHGPIHVERTEAIAAYFRGHVDESWTSDTVPIGR